MALVNPCISLCGRVNFHLGFDSSFAKLILCDVKEIVVIELCSVLEPSDLGPWLSPGHTNEGNLVAKLIFMVKMGGLGDAGALGMSVVSLSVTRFEIGRGRDSNLTVGRVPTNGFDTNITNSEFEICPHAAGLGRPYLRELKNAEASCQDQPFIVDCPF